MNTADLPRYTSRLVHITMVSVKKVLGLEDPVNPLNKHNDSPHDVDPTVLGWLADVVPSWRQLLQHLIRMFPFVNWIKHYNAQWLIGDLIAGT
jgi:sodium-independent sulfate anion transporter 11